MDSKYLTEQFGETVVRFRHWKCVPWFGVYGNGRIAVRLLPHQDQPNDEPMGGAPIATATLNLPDDELGEDEVCIRNSEEGEGMVDALVNANIVFPPHRVLRSGHIEVPVCRWNVPGYEYGMQS